MSDSDGDAHPASVHVARYSEHASRLQNWIGGYGAGLGSLLVYQYRTALSSVAETWPKSPPPQGAVALNAVMASMHAALSIAFILIAFAIAAQVSLLGLNKLTQLTLANMSENEKEWSAWDKSAAWVSRQYWLDAICDLTSIFLLVVATYYGLLALRLVG